MSGRISIRLRSGDEETLRRMAQERGLPLTTFVRVMIEIGMGQLTVLEAMERFQDRNELIAREILARTMATAVQSGVDKEKLEKGRELAGQIIDSIRRQTEEEREERS
jgi:hypothetical protein